MHKFGLGLFIACMSAATAIANPAETKARIQGHLKQKQYTEAVKVAQAIPDPVGRSLMLLGIAQAQREDTSNFKSDDTFELAVSAVRDVTDPSERALRLATMAWLHERRFEKRLCRKEGNVFTTASKLLEEAGQGVGDQGAAAMQKTLGAPGSDPEQIHAWFVAATLLHAAGSKDAATKAMAEACVAVSRVDQLDVRARLLLEAANMSRWMGDAEGGALRMRDARVFAAGLTNLKARLVTLRMIAESYAELESRDGVNATIPALLAGLNELPQSARDGKANWLLELAKLQSKVGASDAIRETLNRLDGTMSAVVKAYGMNPKIRKLLDEAADLRISNGDIDGFLAYAARRSKRPSDRYEYYEQRVRWLLGLGSGKLGDFGSSIGGRKPSELDCRVAIGVADRIRIDSRPFSPLPNARFVDGKRGKADERRDGLFEDMARRFVKLDHLDLAESACARLVNPSSMASELMAVARAKLESDDTSNALRLLDSAWLCLEALAPEQSRAAFLEYADSTQRGGKYAQLAELYHDSGRTGRALEALDRVREMYKHAKHSSSRYMLAQYLATSHHEIGDAFNAKRYCSQFIDIVVAGKDPFQGLLDAAISLDLSDYTDGVRACLDRARPMADDGSVAVATRFDRYLKLAAARNGKLEDGSGEAPAAAAMRLTAATKDPEQRKQRLNRLVDCCTMIGAPKTLLAAYDLYRPAQTDAERNLRLLGSVKHVCKQGFHRLHLGVNPIVAATALSDACTDLQSRATGYMSIVSRCYGDRKTNDGERMLGKLRAIPPSDTFRPEQSIAIAVGEWVASYYKRGDAEASAKLWESSYARLVNAPENEDDDRLVSRATTLARLGDGRTPELAKRAIDAARAMANRISDAARQASVLKQISRKTS